MVEEIIFIYSICCDLLKKMGFVDDKQCKMNAAEVMTVALVSATYFHGNHDLARRFLKAHGYIRYMLSKSRFNRRVHSIDFDLWQIIFSSLRLALQGNRTDLEYVIDSFPVEACHNARSHRCKILCGKNFIGYCSSKRKYYYGVKVHMITTTFGIPMELSITPASTADITALKAMQLTLLKDQPRRTQTTSSRISWKKPWIFGSFLREKHLWSVNIMVHSHTYRLYGESELKRRLVKSLDFSLGPSRHRLNEALSWKSWFSL